MKPETDFLLTAIRAATLRSRLESVELDSVGTALRHGLICHDAAIEWLHEINLLNHVLYRPEFANDQQQAR
jgi:hypothetical protein